MKETGLTNVESMRDSRFPLFREKNSVPKKKVVTAGVREAQLLYSYLLHRTSVGRINHKRET